MKPNRNLTDHAVEKIGEGLSTEERKRFLLNAELPERYNHYDVTEKDRRAISHAMRNPAEKPDLSELLSN